MDEPFGCAEVPAIQLIARQEICLRPDCFVLEKVLGNELLNQRAQELRVDREIFERPHFVAHNGHGLLGIIRGHIQPDRRESVIAEARRHRVGQIPLAANLTEEPPREYRGSDPQWRRIGRIGAWTEEIALQIIRRELAAQKHHIGPSRGECIGCGPGIGSGGKLANAPVDQCFDLLARHIAHNNEHHARRHKRILVIRPKLRGGDLRN